MILTREPMLRKRVNLEITSGGRFWTNPSLAPLGKEYLCTIKGVNYDRETIWYNQLWQALDPSERFSAKNKLLRLDHNYKITDSSDIDTENLKFGGRGMDDVEDIRLFWSGKKLMALGFCTQKDVFCSERRWFQDNKIDRTFIGELIGNKLVDVTIFASPTGSRDEKNWLAANYGNELAFIINVNNGAILKFRTGTNELVGDDLNRNDFTWKGGWSGSSCLVAWSGCYIGVVHRHGPEPRVYKHMIVMFDEDLRPIRRSKTFSFEGKPVEFCSGLILDQQNNVAIVSYGIWDKSAVICEFALDEFMAMISFEVENYGCIAHVDIDDKEYYLSHCDEVLRCAQETIKSFWEIEGELVAAARPSPHAATGMLPDKTKAMNLPRYRVNLAARGSRIKKFLFHWSGRRARK